MKLGCWKTSHFGSASISRRFGREDRSHDDVEIGHRRLQFGAQLAPPPHRLQIVHAGNECAEHQAGAHPLSEIGQPGARPFLVGGGALHDRDQRAAGVPILQRRELHLADFRAEPAQRIDRGGDATLCVVADLVIGLVEMVDHADPGALDPAAERRGVIRDRPVGAGRVARIMAGERLQHQRAILGGPRHRPDMVEAERRRRDFGAADEPVGWLHSGDAAIGCWAADRSASIGADAAEDHAGGDRRTGTAAAAGSEMVSVPRVPRRRLRQVE